MDCKYVVSPDRRGFTRWPGLEDWGVRWLESIGCLVGDDPPDDHPDGYMFTAIEWVPPRDRPVEEPMKITVRLGAGQVFKGLQVE